MRRPQTRGVQRRRRVWGVRGKEHTGETVTLGRAVAWSATWEHRRKRGAIPYNSFCRSVTARTCTVLYYSTPSVSGGSESWRAQVCFVRASSSPWTSCHGSCRASAVCPTHQAYWRAWTACPPVPSVIRVTHNEYVLPIRTVPLQTSSVGA